MYILATTYKKMRYPAHLYLFIGFCLDFTMSICRFATGFFDTSNGADTVSYLWSIMNTLFVLGIYFVFFAFMFVRYNKTHLATIIVAFLFGLTLYLIITPEFRTLVFDPDIGAWVSEYSPVVMLAILPSVAVCIISFIIPLLSKIRNVHTNRSKNQLLLQLTGIAIVLGWGGLIAFTGNDVIRSIRPFLFPLGVFIWSLTLAIDPINVMVSNAKLTDIVIINKCGLLVYDYDFKAKKETSDELVSALLSGVLGALEYISSRAYKEPSTLSQVVYKDKVIGVISDGYLYAFVIGEQFDMVLGVILKSLLKDLQTSPNLTKAINATCVALTVEHNKFIAQKVKDMLGRVLLDAESIPTD